MARRKTDDDELSLPPPAMTLEGRENQLVAAAYDLAEQRIAQGTASASEVVHFLKIGSVQSKLQNEKLRAENEVLISRVKEMENRSTNEELVAEAFAAFKGYTGDVAVVLEDDYDY